MESIYCAPNPILFGVGSSKETGKKLKEFGCTKVILVYDMGIKKVGVVDKIDEIIRAEGIETVYYDNVQADPPIWSVEEAGALAVKEKCDGVVGIGGGSSLDTAKGTKLLITNPPPLRQYFGRVGVVTKPSVPLIVIPTTAGTGSECTPGGVITDTEKNIKTNIAGTGCTVNLGIVDPELTVGLPRFITAYTGFDALGHCAEAYTSRLANSICSCIAREGIQLIGKYLVRACNDGTDMEARAGMSLAASLGGMAMSGPYCHLPHDIGRSLGTKFHVPHGNGCCATLPQVLQMIAGVKTEEVKFIAGALGNPVPDGASVEEIGKYAYDAALKLMKDTGVPSLQDLKLNLDDLLREVPAEVVMQMDIFKKLGFGVCTCPLDITEEDVANVLTRAYYENHFPKEA